MKPRESTKVNPIALPKTHRIDQQLSYFDFQAGKSVPLAYIPVLREDRCTGRVRINVELAPTVKKLLNSVHITAYAHFIPYLASDRFNGMDQLNRSYMEQPETEGGAPIPFIKTLKFNKNMEFWKVLGVQYKDGDDVNSWPIEAYNILQNYRRSVRSDKLPLRGMYDTHLARAFWKNGDLSNIVPDFDQAMIDGEVPLDIGSSQIPVSGIGYHRDIQVAPLFPNMTVQETSGQVVYDQAAISHGATANDSHISLNVDAKTLLPKIFAEMQEGGITISLANLELAKKTKAFAELRQQYQGIDDDYVIDMLMSGLRVPEEALKQPILLDRKHTIFGYHQRYATDGANLTEQITDGQSFVELRMRTPQMNMGGIIMITMEVVPDNIFERRLDPFLSVKKSSDFPNAQRDFLDPEKVTIVKNKDIDVQHSNPDGIFGFRPLNYQWKRNQIRLGGNMYKPTPTEVPKEDRLRLWTNDVKDPTLNEAFSLVPELQNNVFYDAKQPPVSGTLQSYFDIVGLTQFGKKLHEDDGSYQDVLEDVPTERNEVTETTNKPAVKPSAPTKTATKGG